MNIPEIAGIVEAFERGEHDVVIQEFLNRPAEFWLDDGYEWKEDNAERFSTFIQELIPLLPKQAPMENVYALAQNYLLAICFLPCSPDLAARAVTTFWNMHRKGDPDQLREFYRNLEDNPDGERVREIAATAIGL